MRRVNSFLLLCMTVQWGRFDACTAFRMPHRMMIADRCLARSLTRWSCGFTLRMPAKVEASAAIGVCIAGGLRVMRPAKASCRTAGRLLPSITPPSSMLLASRL